MGTIIRFPLQCHARTSADGRGTLEGQSQPSGQRSENQSMTSSYLRAVNVVEPSTTRSKKRQSPAARRPKVVRLSDLDSAYAEAQAMRFERNSVSMAEQPSRSFPTLQAEKVGIFQLASKDEKSDKSAMPTVDQIRQKILTLMAAAGDRPIPLAEEFGLERNHLRDYFEGKKRSLKIEVLQQLSERYDIPLSDLVAKKEKQNRRRA